MQTSNENIKKSTKSLIGGIATMGVGTIVFGAIASILPSNAKFLTKTVTAITGVIIGMMVSEQIETYLNGKIDKVFESISIEDASDIPEEVEA